MRLFKPFIIFVLLTVPTAHARNIESRLGIGFVDQFSNSTPLKQVPAISAKYGFTKEINFAGAIGLNTMDPTTITLGGKVFKNIFYETNLNFYAAGGLAYVKKQESGLEILGLLGAEFFIPGIESLGLSFEAGLSLSNVTGSFALQTVGFTFLNAGMHFYF